MFELSNKTQFNTVGETCKILRISRPTFIRRMKDGTIPTYRPTPGRVLVPAAWIEQQIASAMAKAVQK